MYVAWSWLIIERLSTWWTISYCCKLELYGIVNRELAWCHSYLLDRKQVVRVNGSESTEALMLHGVPQGSILGPLFFILFINDLPLYTSAQLDLYADDTTVTASAVACEHRLICGREKLNHLKFITK